MKFKLNIMKNLKKSIPMILGFLIGTFMLLACEDERIELAENPEQREEAFQQILSNEELFNDFMNEVRGSDQSMEWMAGHRPMMQNMYGRNQMRHMMRNNPEVMDSIMDVMMVMVEKDTSMLNKNPRMQQRLAEHMMIMMDRDTALYQQMQQRMQQKR